MFSNLESHSEGLQVNIVLHTKVLSITSVNKENVLESRLNKEIDGVSLLVNVKFKD